MKKKFSALILFSLVLLPSSAWALQVDDLVALTAMPLAVAAVADIADVPATDLMTVVSTLNRANVPPPQFIEIVRYTPVALVETTTEPRFVTYVTTQYDRGLTGNALAYSIAEQFPTYGVQEVQIVDPPVMTIVQRQILPQVVVTRFQPVQFDPLALVAMPLAVAAVSDITGVPSNDLFNFIVSLNQARVPAPQFVEIVRYSPVVFVDPNASPAFLSFVTTEIDRGVIGTPLAVAIADRFDTFGMNEIAILDPPVTTIIDRDVFIPQVVTTRVAEVRSHPHGGPPGQLKKDLGLQTGAEVVHGTKPGRTARVRSARSVDRSNDVKVTRPAKPRTVKVQTPKAQTPKKVRTVTVQPVKPQPQSQGKGHGKPQVTSPQGKQNKGQGPGNQGQDKGQGQSKGKGKGKG